MIRLLLARLLAWSSRRCGLLSERLDLASDRAYREYYRRENRKAARESNRRAAEQEKRDAAAADDLIAETRPAKRVGAPIHRDR